MMDALAGSVGGTGASASIPLVSSVIQNLLLAKGAIGAGRKTANAFVNKFQNPLGNKIIGEINQFNSTGNKDLLTGISNDWNELNGDLIGFGSQTLPTFKTVASQASKSLQWIPDFLKGQGISVNDAGVGADGKMGFLDSFAPSVGATGGSSGNSVVDSILNTLSLGGLKLPGLGGGSSRPGAQTPFPGGGSGTQIPSWLLALLSSVAGGLNNRATSQTPTFDSAINPLRNAAIGSFTNLLKDPDLSGYFADQSNSINTDAAAQKQNTEETLASKGISGPALTTALSSVENNRINKISTLKNNIPILSRQLQLDALNPISSFINGSRGTRNSGNVAGGAVSGAAQALLLSAILGGK